MNIGESSPRRSRGVYSPIFTSPEATNCFSIITLMITVNPLLSPPGGLFFSSTFEGGLNRQGGLKREGGLFNLAKRITYSKNTVV